MRVFAYLLFSIILTFSWLRLAESKYVCRYNTAYYCFSPKICYSLESFKAANWSMAVDVCKQQGGYLPSLNLKTEEEAIKTFVEMKKWELRPNNFFWLREFRNSSSFSKKFQVFESELPVVSTCPAFRRTAKNKWSKTMITCNKMVKVVVCEKPCAETRQNAEDEMHTTPTESSSTTGTTTQAFLDETSAAKKTSTDISTTVPKTTTVPITTTVISTTVPKTTTVPITTTVISTTVPKTTTVPITTTVISTTVPKTTTVPMTTTVISTTVPKTTTVPITTTVISTTVPESTTVPITSTFITTTIPVTTTILSITRLQTSTIPIVSSFITTTIPATSTVSNTSTIKTTTTIPDTSTGFTSTFQTTSTLNTTEILEVTTKPTISTLNKNVSSLLSTSVQAGTSTMTWPTTTVTATTTPSACFYNGTSYEIGETISEYEKDNCTRLVCYESGIEQEIRTSCCTYKDNAYQSQQLVFSAQCYQLICCNGSLISVPYCGDEFVQVVYHNTMSCYHASSSTMTRLAAQMYCLNLGATLAAPATPQMFNRLKDFLLNNVIVKGQVAGWLGAIKDGGMYYWQTKKPRLPLSELDQVTSCQGSHFDDYSSFIQIQYTGNSKSKEFCWKGVSREAMAVAICTKC